MHLLKLSDKGRDWKVDSCRGLAVILMVIFNYSFTLRYFNIYSVEGGWFYWYLFPRIIGGVFIFLAGFSLMISYKNNKSKATILHNGIKIFSLGLLITLVTWFLFSRDFIIFGILHLIGLSIILSSFFIRFRHKILLGIAFILAGLYLGNLIFDFPWLLWLGLVPREFYTFDYWPLLPWFGLFLIGMHFGNIYEIKKKAIRNPVINIFSSLGRNSLVIYLIHQVLLVIFLFLFFGTTI